MGVRKLLLAAAFVLSVMASGCQSPFGCCPFSKCRPNYVSYYPRACPAPTPCYSCQTYPGSMCCDSPCGNCGCGNGMGEGRGIDSLEGCSCGSHHAGYRGLVPQSEYEPRNAGEKRDVYYTPAEE